MCIRFQLLLHDSLVFLCQHDLQKVMMMKKNFFLLVSKFLPQDFKNKSSLKLLMCTNRQPNTDKRLQKSNEFYFHNLRKSPLFKGEYPRHEGEGFFLLLLDGTRHEGTTFFFYQMSQVYDNIIMKIITMSFKKGIIC